jgi:hypothetical protein
VPFRRPDSQICCLPKYSPTRRCDKSWFGRKAGHDSESKQNARSLSEFGKDLLSTEWREPSTSLAYIQSRTKRITAVCFYNTESSVNHLVYMDFFNSHDPCPIVRSVHEIYCFFFSFCRAFFSSCFLSICSISSASFLLAYHWPACRIKTPTSKRAKMVSLAARTLSESSLLR